LHAWAAALQDADLALALDPASAKALHRRATALERLARSSEGESVAATGFAQPAS
jgi:hypothetical protein